MLPDQKPTEVNSKTAIKYAGLSIGCTLLLPHFTKEGPYYCPNFNGGETEAQSCH